MALMKRPYRAVDTATLIDLAGDIYEALDQRHTREWDRDVKPVLVRALKLVEDELAHRGALIAVGSDTTVSYAY